MIDDGPSTKVISLKGEAVIPATEYHLYGHALHVCCALGCCCHDLTSLILHPPACLVSSAHCSCCCLSVQTSFCKISAAEDELGLHACICLDGRCAQVVPQSCLRLTCHQCCLDFRCSLPREADSEVPCIAAAAGVMCCYEGRPLIACCPTIDSLRAKARVDPEHDPHAHPTSHSHHEQSDEARSPEHAHHSHHSSHAHHSHHSSHHSHHHHKHHHKHHHHHRQQTRRSSFTSAHSGKHHKIRTATGLDDFYPFLALGCCVQSCLLVCPDACGWSAFLGCCCCRHEHLCCKPSVLVRPLIDPSFNSPPHIPYPLMPSNPPLHTSLAKRRPARGYCLWRRALSPARNPTVVHVSRQVDLVRLPLLLPRFEVSVAFGPSFPPFLSLSLSLCLTCQARPLHLGAPSPSTLAPFLACSTAASSTAAGASSFSLYAKEFFLPPSHLPPPHYLSHCRS